MNHTVARRDVLKGLGASAIMAPAVFCGSRARAALPNLPNLPDSEALLLRPGQAHFADYQPAFNARVMVTPELRALCKTANAVAVVLDWCRTNNLTFALRSGGHCYEGLSQSSSVVIDTRLMNRITVDKTNHTVTVGAGASLGAIYKVTGALGYAIPAGSCPTVGVSGHVLGGGYGYLGRPLGLACDSLQAVSLIDPQGKTVEADTQQHADLFWACRGGGGSFGAATSFRFQMHAVPKVVTFGISWRLPPARAVKIFKTWQAWAPQAPNAIAALIRFSQDPHGGLDLRCFGQSIGGVTQLKAELKALSSSPDVKTMAFLPSVNHFAGKDGWTYSSGPMKGKSDYVMTPLGDDGILALMEGVAARTGITVVCDAYGGAIAGTPPDGTAFAHRAGTLYCIQYASSWSGGDSAKHLKDMSDLYAAMRPYMSGAAYVNYCDVDLANWQTAYWGDNLARLKQIKSAFDPDNVFRHALSIPVT
jgi:FAD binding domain/Berberine and berberine like